MESDPRRSSPSAWLWAELERRLGPDDADAIHFAYNQRMADYSKARRHTPLSPIEQRTPGPKAKRERRIKR